MMLHEAMKLVCHAIVIIKLWNNETYHYHEFRESIV